MARSQRPHGGISGGTTGIPLQLGLEKYLRQFFSYNYGPRLETLTAARVIVYPSNKDGTLSKAYRVKYRCQCCKGIVDRVEIDHIKPVGPMFKWPPIDRTEATNFLERLLCDRSNLQALCSPCHKAKSALETTARAQARRLRRKKPTKGRPTKSANLDRPKSAKSGHLGNSGPDRDRKERPRKSPSKKVRRSDRNHK